jgi:choice-of-anchor A domain-containing protein
MFLSSTRRTSRRALLGTITAGALTTGLLGLGATTPALAATPLATTVLDAPVCTGETLPGISTGEAAFTDQGVAVFVGKNYEARPGAVESEGTLVAGGAVDVATGGLMNFGRAGGGSQIVPPGGSDMLLAGANVSVSNGRIDVGHGIPRGGNVAAGGAVSGPMELNGGAAKANTATARTLADTTAAQLASTSATLAALPATGSLASVDGYPTLTGNGTAATQVFNLTAADLKGLGGKVVFDEVGNAAPIVVNVSGANVEFSMIHTAAESAGNRIDSFEALGDWAPRIVWNFPEATSLKVAGGSQTVGSILVPQEKSKVVQSTNTNGRLWVGGDLTFGGNGGSGLEHHNYPWIGSTDMGCTLTKVPDGGTDQGEEKENPGGGTNTGTTPPPTTTPVAPVPPVDKELAPTGDKGVSPAPSPSTAAPVKDKTSTSSAAPKNEEGLAATGARTTLIVVIATALVAGGAGLVVMARRRAAS